jgi:hypothetical protein
LYQLVTQKGELNMAPPNAKENTDPYPRDFDAAKVRSEIDPPMPGTKGFDAELGKLDMEQGPEKGGC